MGFIVLFRRSRRSSPFREYLHRLAEWDRADALLITTGYLWEHPAGYSVLDDGLLDALRRGPPKVLTTIAGHFRRNTQYGFFYRRFVAKLRGVIPVTAYWSRGGRWHAKVSIAARGGVPVAGIIGSSNLTGPAYGIHRDTFNNEADIVLWSDPADTNYFLAPLHDIEDLAEEDFIVGAIGREYPQPPEAARLAKIYGAIMEIAELEIVEPGLDDDEGE